MGDHEGELSGHKLVCLCCESTKGAATSPLVNPARTHAYDDKSESKLATVNSWFGSLAWHAPGLSLVLAGGGAEVPRA